MNAARLPREARERLVVVTDGEELLWVPGLAVRDGLSLCRSGIHAVLSLVPTGDTPE